MISWPSPTFQPSLNYYSMDVFWWSHHLHSVLLYANPFTVCIWARYISCGDSTIRDILLGQDWSYFRLEPAHCCSAPSAVRLQGSAGPFGERPLNSVELLLSEVSQTALQRPDSWTQRNASYIFYLEGHPLTLDHPLIPPLMHRSSMERMTTIRWDKRILHL